MRQDIDLSKDVEGELYDQLASSLTRLKHSSNLSSDFIIKADSDVTALNNIKNVFLLLRNEFSSNEGPRIVFENEKKDDMNKRLILLEKEIDGLMRKRIEYSVKDQTGGMRTLDYGNLLNEKENQIVQLEKKIGNLEHRLHRANARQVQLENHILQLQHQLTAKQNVISSKNQIILAEVASANAMRQTVNKLKKNLDMNRHRMGDLQRVLMEGVIIPEIGGFEIKADLLAKDGAMSRSRTYVDSSDNQKIKTRIIQMIRELERINSQTGGLNLDQVERIIENFITTDLRNTKLYESVQIAIKRNAIEEDYKRLKENFAAAAGIYQQAIQELKKNHPEIKINLQSNLFQILRRQRVEAIKAEGGAIFIDNFSQRTVEVPVQDAKTKQLIHMLAVQFKKIVEKYPKLQGQIDQRLMQYFQQQLIDVIETDGIDRLVQVVKFVPQVVKVENVYAYSNEKSRKVQFHLRILIKALLEELQKIKVRTNSVLNIDEGVIGMIRQEIMGVVEVDDILKVFRSVPKIVEVQKIVEKIVEKVVQVPKVEVVEKIVEKVIEKEVIKEVEKVVNVQLEVPKVYVNEVEKIVPIENIIEKVIEVPVVVEKIIEVVKEVPKIQYVDRQIEKVIEVEKIVQVDRVVNHFEKEFVEVEVVREIPVPVQRIEEKIIQIPIYQQKIVEKIVEVPKVIEVEKVVEKVVPQIEYRNAREVLNHIEVQHNVVDRIVEKPIVIMKTVEKVVEVPQVIEKLVPTKVIETKVEEIQVVTEKIVFQEKIKEVEKPIPHIVERVKEVVKEVQKFIQIPVIHEKPRLVEIVVQKPVKQTIKEVQIKEVFLRDPLVIKEPKVIEVEKIVNRFVEVPRIQYIKEDKIVEVPVFRERIKEVKVNIDKIIQKMVEVPKVVETERIVEKIVVVPRVIEKVVEVPQYVEKIVEKEVIKTQIKEVERRVEVPVIQEKVVEYEVEKNVFIEVERAVEKIVDKIVQVPKEIKLVEIQKVIEEKFIQFIKQVPRNIEVEKIVPLYEETAQVIQIERPIVVPVEVPVIVDRIVQKMVPVPQVRERVIPVPQIIEKIMTIKEEDVVVREIEKVVERIVIDTQVKEIQKIVPLIKEVITEVPTIVQKIVPVCTTVQEIVTAQQIIEKIVEKAITIPKIKEVERVKEVMVEIPKFIEIERIVPQIQRVNQYIEKIVEKIVEVPVIIERIKEIEKEVEKVVQVQNQTKEVIEVERNIETIAIMEKIKEVVRNVNQIERVVEVVERLEQMPVQIVAREEILVEVPVLMEKIVQKIVVMPQIVEVLKYVHEVCETDSLGVAVEGEQAAHEQKYRMLSQNMRGQLDVLLRQLRVLRSENPRMGARIELLEKFLGEFEKFILFPRIIKVPEEKIVEKEVQKIVKVPFQDEKTVRMELTLSLLVEKLLLELKRVKEKTGASLELDDDIKLIFFSELRTRGNLEGEFGRQIESYCSQMQRQFEQFGPWAVENQFMLNTFLQERFVMAELVHNANIQIQKSREMSEKRLQGLRRYKNDRIAFDGFLQNIIKIVSKYNPELQENLSEVINILRDYERYTNGEIKEPVMLLGDLVVNDERTFSLLRQKDDEIVRLKQMLISRQSGERNESERLQKLKDQNSELRNLLKGLESRLSSEEVDNILIPFQQQINELQTKNFELETQVSELRSANINLSSEIRILHENAGSKLVFVTGEEPFISSFEGSRSEVQRRMTTTTIPQNQRPHERQDERATEGGNLGTNFSFGGSNLGLGGNQRTGGNTERIQGGFNLGIQGGNNQGIQSERQRIEGEREGQYIPERNIQGQTIQGTNLQQGAFNQGYGGNQGGSLQGSNIIQGGSLQGSNITGGNVQGGIQRIQGGNVVQSSIQGQGGRIQGGNIIQGGIQGQGGFIQGQGGIIQGQGNLSGQGHLTESREIQFYSPIQGARLVQSGIRERETEGSQRDPETVIRSDIMKPEQSPDTTARQTEPRIIRAPHILTPQKKKEEEKDK